MNLTYEQIHSALLNLGPNDQRRLFDELARMLGVAGGASESSAVVVESPTSRDTNDRWLETNADLYRGQWVALKDGDLIAHSSDGKAFVKAVQDSGIECPLLLLIPPRNGSPQIGSWDLILPNENIASTPIH
ncbi:MAG: DUF5678 domain-containing protein [Blastocatellia bacterium]